MFPRIIPIISGMLISYCFAESSNVTNLSTDCNNSTDSCGNVTLFTPPPSEAMSRLLPSRSSVFSNETKDTSASTVDIVTTPESSIGLSAFSKFAQTSSTEAFSPSPFLGVISDVKSFPGGVAIGEVFPDTLGERHLAHKYIYSFAGQKGHHTGHSYHDQAKQGPASLGQFLENQEVKPTHETILKSTTGSLFKPSYDTFRPTLQSYYKSTNAPDYQYEYPGKHLSETKYKDITNSITEYKPPYPPSGSSYGLSEKPIKEHIPDDRPYGHGGHSKYPGHPHSVHPHYNKEIGLKDGSKWKSVFKFLATLIPFGILVAALSPSILVVNATDSPIPMKTTYRSLDGPQLNLTLCQMKKLCEEMTSAEPSFLPYIAKLGKTVLNDAAEMSAAGRCNEIRCKQ